MPDAATQTLSPETEQVVQQYLGAYGVDASGGGLSASILIAWIIFGAIGMGALMVYPYFVRGALALYGIGIGLTALLVFWRE